ALRGTRLVNAVFCFCGSGVPAAIDQRKNRSTQRAQSTQSTQRKLCVLSFLCVLCVEGRSPRHANRNEAPDYDGCGARSLARTAVQPAPTTSRDVREDAAPTKSDSQPKRPVM